MLEIILQYGKISRNVVFVWTCWYFYLFSTRFFYYWCCVNYNEPTQHWWKSQKNCKKSRKIKNFPLGKLLFSSGGETGIRTLEPLRTAGFQDRCIRPLCHLSKMLSKTVHAVYKKFWICQNFFWFFSV